MIKLKSLRPLFGPFPEPEQRKEIWRKVFPSRTPVDEGLDYERLAKLNLTGGGIFNTALNAAFLAAQEDGVVTMPLVLNSAQTEIRKLKQSKKKNIRQPVSRKKSTASKGAK